MDLRRGEAVQLTAKDIAVRHVSCYPKEKIKLSDKRRRLISGRIVRKIITDE